MNVFFFQKIGDSIGNDVATTVLSILNGHPIPPKLNHTLVTLIPKKPRPEYVSKFRPISLCNVVYKLVTKVLVSRLKPILPSIVSATQGAFTQGWLISNNILITFEVLHAMRHDSSVAGSMAVKMDMSKAFDRVERPFLARTMLKMGFRTEWLDLVMRCVKSALFSFLVNGSPSGYVLPSKGIRQGDPISPYLFLFCSEGLIGLLTKAVECASLRGYRLCAQTPIISHLLFINDIIIFCGADNDQASVLKHILVKYEQALGRLINFVKTDVSFSKGVSAERRNQITLLLDIQEVLSHYKYLGALTFVGRSRKEPFLFMVDRIKKRISNWMGKLALSLGREALIKAVA